MNSAELAIGYEAGAVPGAFAGMGRGDLIAAARKHLHDEAIAAMRGERALVHHIESGAIAVCPLDVALAELMHVPMVSMALIRVLRHSRCLSVDQLRTVIANEYADALAPRLADQGGLV